MILGQNGLLNSVLLSLHLLVSETVSFGVGAVLVVLRHTYLPFQILSVMTWWHR
jgi:ABC-type spermidine/putrescine transport system permease subunit I